MNNERGHGFTIVELLIVIVVIGILASITLVAFNGIQTKARNSRKESDVASVVRKIELYKVDNGSYPKTADTLYTDYNTNTARTDANCDYGSKSIDWVPGLTSLPQSPQGTIGAKGYKGCYMYVSDGVNYVVSAWNMLESPQTNIMYRRLGFRETPIATQFYLCNHAGIGGVAADGTYSATNDMYKYSYTASSFSCNETPPTGA